MTSSVPRRLTDGEETCTEVGDKASGLTCEARADKKQRKDLYYIELTQTVVRVSHCLIGFSLLYLLSLKAKSLSYAKASSENQELFFFHFYFRCRLDLYASLQIKLQNADKLFV